MTDMHWLIEYFKRWFHPGDDYEILDDDYDPPMIMHYMRPEEKIDREPQAADAQDELK